jgi:hypothetical protein
MDSLTVCDEGEATGRRRPRGGVRGVDMRAGRGRGGEMPTFRSLVGLPVVVRQLIRPSRPLLADRWAPDIAVFFVPERTHLLAGWR